MLPAMKPNRWILAAFAAAIGVALIVLLVQLASRAIVDRERQMDFVYLVILLAAMSGGFLLRLRRAPGTTLGQIGLWVVIFAGLMTLYSFRGDFAAIGDRFRETVSPLAGRAESGGGISFPADADGHYRLQATIDGIETLFLVDTGATGIVLSPAAAKALGYDLETLPFGGMMRSANGLVRVAPIRIAELRIGSIAMRDLPAAVNSAPMPVSLLGMEFLSRLKSWRAEQGRLILEP